VATKSAEPMIDQRIGNDLSTEAQHERLRKIELCSNPRPHERPDESERNGRDETARAAARERSTMRRIRPR